MKPSKLVGLFMAIFICANISFSQLIFSSSVMTQYYWDGSKWMFAEENDNDNSIFVFSKDMKSMSHIEGNNISTYAIKSIKSDSIDSFELDIVGSNGKKYIAIVSTNKSKPFVIILFTYNGQNIMFSYTES